MKRGYDYLVYKKPDKKKETARDVRNRVRVAYEMFFEKYSRHPDYIIMCKEDFVMVNAKSYNNAMLSTRKGVLKWNFYLGVENDTSTSGMESD